MVSSPAAQAPVQRITYDYSALYEPHPEVFMTGRLFRIDVYDAREPGRVHKSITVPESAKLIQQIRNDFKTVVKRSGS